MPSFLTDGSNIIFEGHFEEDELKITKQHPIFEESASGIRTPVYRLNEIEFVNGRIFANIWQKNDIYELDMENDRITR